MLVATACLLILLLAWWCHTGTKDPPLDREVVRRVRRFAEQIRREQILPYE